MVTDLVALHFLTIQRDLVGEDDWVLRPRDSVKTFGGQPGDLYGVMRDVAETLAVASMRTHTEARHSSAGGRTPGLPDRVWQQLMRLVLDYRDGEGESSLAEAYEKEARDFEGIELWGLCEDREVFHRVSLVALHATRTLQEKEQFMEYCREIGQAAMMERAMLARRWLESLRTLTTLQSEAARKKGPLSGSLCDREEGDAHLEAVLRYVEEEHLSLIHI